MTEDELWNHFLKRNPSLESNNPTFTKEGLKKFFSAVFQSGYEQGQKQERALEEMRKSVKPKDSGLGELYETIFGKGKL